jgi:type I restriction enzyme S subunit
MVCNRELPNHFVLRWAQTNTEVFRGRANGTTFPEISKANFRPIQMIIPPSGIVQKFTDQAQVIHQQVVNNLRQSRTLIYIRNALLPKLLSGEIRVKDAERFAERAA